LQSLLRVVEGSSAGRPEVPCTGGLLLRLQRWVARVESASAGRPEELCTNGLLPRLQRDLHSRPPMMVEIVPAGVPRLLHS
jgi:hypothetical protein